MGADLDGDGGRAPSFLVWALADPEAAPLQRVQVIKGWEEGGESFEKVFDVVCSDGLEVDPATQRCPDNGAVVESRRLLVLARRGGEPARRPVAGSRVRARPGSLLLPARAREPDLPLVDLGGSACRRRSQERPSEDHPGACLVVADLGPRCGAIRELSAAAGLRSGPCPTRSVSRESQDHDRRDRAGRVAAGGTGAVRHLPHERRPPTAADRHQPVSAGSGSLGSVAHASRAR